MNTTLAHTASAEGDRVQDVSPVDSGAIPRLRCFLGSGCAAGGQSMGMSTSVTLPGVAAFTAATTSATCG
jgi:hypothetical protein